MLTLDIFIEMLCISASLSVVYFSLQPTDRLSIDVFLLPIFIFLSYGTVYVLLSPYESIIGPLLFMSAISIVKTKDFIRSIYVSALSATLVFSFLNLWSSILVDLSSESLFQSLDTINFTPLQKNIGLILLILLYCFLRHRYSTRIKSRKSMFFITLYCLAVLYILVYYMPSLRETNAIIILIRFQAMLSLSLVANIYIALIINSIETKLQQKEADIIYLSAMAKDKEQQFQSATTLKHNIKSLYLSLAYYIANEDLAGLHQFFTDKIEPIHQELVDDQNLSQTLNKINDLTIRSTIFGLANCCANDNIPFKLTASPVTRTLEAKACDLVKILGILCDNAYLEARRADKPQVLIEIFQDQRHSSIVIKNSYGDLSKDAGAQAAYDTPLMETRHGQGLYMVADLQELNSNIELNTKKSGNWFIQQLIIKRRI